MDASLRHLFAALALALTLVTPTTALAWRFELSNANGDATVEVYFDPQGSATLNAYTLFFDYDAAKLDFASGDNQTPPAPLQGDFFGKASNPVDGQVHNVNGGAMTGGATMTTKTLIGTVPFVVSPTGVINGTPDVTFAPSRRGFLVAVNGSLFEGASVSVVVGAGLELPRPACADGADNDGDALIDHPSDKGCAAPSSLLENPQCDDGLDNDGDGTRDWDGAGVGAPDPHCTTGSRNKETRCGIGFELALVVPLLAAARRKRRSAVLLLVAVLCTAVLLPAAARAEEPGDTPAFRAAAQALPLLTLEVQPGSEIWIRVDPDHAAEAREVMAQVGAFYRQHRGGAGPVRVLLFVGQRVLAGETYGD